MVILRLFRGSWAIVGALAVLGCLAGCGNASEEAAEAYLESSLNSEGAEVDLAVDEDAQQVSISANTNDGSVEMNVGENTRIPAEFPQDVPIFEGIKVVMANVMQEKEMFQIQGSVEAPVGDVAAFYKERAPAEGWEEMQAFSQPTMQNLTYQKGDRMLNVTLIGEEATTNVTIHTGVQD